MKVLGIVAEYNPFHNGHKYHLEEAKRITNSDYVVVIMSGNFTEQGNIAIYDKFTRAKLAILNGADLVIELPTIYANSSAEYFASASINLLDKIGIVNSICFGTETDNIQELDEISTIILENENSIWNEIKANLKDGITLAKSRQLALSKYLSENLVETLSKSNNILGIEYLKALKKLNSNISPYIIKRDSSHNISNISLNTENKNFTSATSIRKEIYNDNMVGIKKYVPESTYNVICSNKPAFNEDMYNILRYKISSMSKNEIYNIFEVNEGLENKIIKANSISINYEDLIKNVKSKRYVESRIRRIMINIVLGISKDMFNNNLTYANLYAHILCMSQKGKELLPELSDKSRIPIITSINDRTILKYATNIQSLIRLDIFSNNLYSIINSGNLNTDYLNKL